MNKEIYFCVDNDSFYSFKVLPSNKSMFYSGTEERIKDNRELIITTSLAHLSFDLITMGYDIYLCYKDKKVKIEPHMDLSGIGEPCKDLRFGHNILRLFLAGIFDGLLVIEKGK